MVLFLHSLRKRGYLDNINMTICNVGSRKISPTDDYASQGWQIFAPNLTIYGFDIDADACEAANTDLEKRKISWIEEHHPLALSNEIGERTVYVTNNPMCSSLYLPNENFQARFSGLPLEVVGLDFTFEIETITLDEFCQERQVASIDFLQIDVQGGDLDILKGATQILPSVMAIQIEVEFVELYHNQPLFGDVDAFLRKQGFSLFDVSIARRKRLNSPIFSQKHPGQIIWGDAYYLRDPLKKDCCISYQTPQRLFKVACIADVMDFTDYSVELLEYLTIVYGENSDYNYADIILETLQTLTDIPNKEIPHLTLIQKLEPYLSSPI